MTRSDKWTDNNFMVFLLRKHIKLIYKIYNVPWNSIHFCHFWSKWAEIWSVCWLTEESVRLIQLMNGSRRHIRNSHNHVGDHKTNACTRFPTAFGAADHTEKLSQHCFCLHRKFSMNPGEGAATDSTYLYTVYRVTS